MDYFQKAENALRDHLTQEHGPLQNVRVMVKDYQEADGDWSVVMTTTAHTDRNYSVTYKAESGRTTIKTFVEAKETTVYDERPPVNVPPMDEPVQTQKTDEYWGVHISNSRNVQFGDRNNQTNNYRS